MDTPKATIVKCPTCGRSVEWSSVSPWRPFCSERCKLADLGAWFSENRSVAGEESAELIPPGDTKD